MSESDKKELILGKFKDYQELEKAFQDQANELKNSNADRDEMATFVEKMAPYLVVDTKTGKVSFNEPVIKEAIGIKDEPVGKKESKKVENTSDEKKESSAPQFSMDDVKKMIEEAVSSKISPIQKKLKTDDASQWIGELREQYPDFDNYKSEMMEFLKQSGQDPNSKEEIERIYHAEKAKKGGYVDKSQVEKERADFLTNLSEATGTVFDPSTAFEPSKPITEISDNELLGLPENHGEKVDDDASAEALFDKPRRVLPPE
jgi:hypothetical protein